VEPLNNAGAVSLTTTNLLPNKPKLFSRLSSISTGSPYPTVTVSGLTISLSYSNQSSLPHQRQHSQGDSLPPPACLQTTLAL